MQSKNQENCDKKAIRLDKEIEKKQGIRIVKIERKYVSRFDDPVEYEASLFGNQF